MKAFYITDKIANKTTYYAYITEAKEKAIKRKNKYIDKGINAKVYEGKHIGFEIVIEEVK